MVARRKIIEVDRTSVEKGEANTNPLRKTGMMRTVITTDN